MKRQVLSVLVLVFFLFLCFTAYGSEEKEVTLYFTHDIHSYLDPVPSEAGRESLEHGGGARLSSALSESGFYEDENAVFLDGGDFSQGTLFQTGFEEEAFELRLLGRLGGYAVTPGNHEWDHGGRGFAKMLESAMESGDPLPAVCLSNLDFSGELTEEQLLVRDTLASFSEKVTGDPEFRYRVWTAGNGIRIGIFAVSGEGSIEDSPTSGMKWRDRIEAAGEMTEILKEQCDLIVCLSHSGMDSREKGEDLELAKAVPEIDFILSGHSHSLFEEPVLVGNTVIGCTGEYLENLGKVTFSFPEGQKASMKEYDLIPIDETVPEDPETKAYLTSCKQWIDRNYLSQYQASYDEVVCMSSYDMISLSEMYRTHQEYTMGNLIADSYLYAARQNGMEDIDVALVGLGTIRGSIRKGPVRLSDAFGICSLGMGADGSAGHPIVSGYITGKELKLLAELDASLGGLVSSIKMSYSGTGPDGTGSGLSYTFDEKRLPFNRVTEIHLLKDGEPVEIEDDRLYRAACNMYAANMLGMLNGLTKGLLSITPKDAEGVPIGDLYTCSLLTPEGKEIKEWAAFKDYLESFDDTNGDGISDLPLYYGQMLGRKRKVNRRGPSATLVAAVLFVSLLAGGIFLIRKRRKKKRKGNKTN